MLEEWVNQIPLGAVLVGASFLFGIWMLFKKIKKELTETTSGWFKRAFLTIIEDDEVMQKLSDKVPRKENIEMMKRLEDLAGTQDHFSGRLEEMMAALENVHGDVEALAMETRKNFLVSCISNIEQGEPMEEIELERFHESYQKYIDGGGNSYVKGRVEKLKKEGKL